MFTPGIKFYFTPQHLYLAKVLPLYARTPQTLYMAKIVRLYRYQDMLNMSQHFVFDVIKCASSVSLCFHEGS